MERRGELRTYPGRTVPVKAFVADVRADLAGANVRLAVADEYKSAELRDCLALAVNGRADRGGAGRERGGPGVSIGDFDQHAGAHVQHEPRECHQGIARCGGTVTAIPRLTGRGRHGRIDVLSAAVLAVGAATKYRAKRGGIVRSAICEATA